MEKTVEITFTVKYTYATKIELNKDYHTRSQITNKDEIDEILQDNPLLKNQLVERSNEFIKYPMMKIIDIEIGD